MRSAKPELPYSAPCSDVYMLLLFADSWPRPTRAGHVAKGRIGTEVKALAALRPVLLRGEEAEEEPGDRQKASHPRRLS